MFLQYHLKVTSVHSFDQQIVNYGENLLERLPVEVRRSVMVGLTNLKTIMWFRITRIALGKYTYEKDTESTSVAASICGILALSSDQVWTRYGIWAAIFLFILTSIFSS